MRRLARSGHHRPAAAQADRTIDLQLLPAHANVLTHTYHHPDAYDFADPDNLADAQHHPFTAGLLHPHADRNTAYPAGNRDEI